MEKKKIRTIHKHILADLLTPVGAYLRLRDVFHNAFLLESADYHSSQDSKSFICLEPIAGFEATGLNIRIEQENKTSLSQTVESHREVFEAFETFLQNFEMVEDDQPDHPPALFGYAAFEAVQYVENINLTQKPNALKANPDLKYQLFRYVLVFDHLRNTLAIAHNSIGDHGTNAHENFDRVLNALKSQEAPAFPFKVTQEEQSTIDDNTYKGFVDKGIQHCRRGDVFQVVLSREFSQGFKGDDFKVYRSLRSINPSPYLFYFDYGSFKIFGASPESQLKVENGVAKINPIAGTIKRGKDAAEDSLLATQLQNDPKEAAEHVMLVDLARNDLSKTASEVTVSTFGDIQYFSHVIHKVSTVTGKLDEPEKSLYVFGDTFPAGTLSGAPKYRALQIIDEAEPAPRNFYGGSIGMIGLDGSINQAIIIRSILSKNQKLTYQAGAGIVADSTPEGELEEVNNKIAVLRKAIENAHTL